MAVRALTEDGHSGRTYVLTGPETLTQAEQVHTIGKAIGRSLRFDEISREQARPGLIAAFGEEEFAAMALDTWAKFVTKPEGRTSTVQEVTGVPPRSLGDWAATTPRTSGEPRSDYRHAVDGMLVPCQS